MSDPKKLQVKVKEGDAARHGTDKAVAILRPLLAMGPVRRCYAILLLALCTAFGPLCTDMYLPALPDIAKDLNISTAFAQASITACLLGLALGQLFMGPVSDGRGRRGPLIFSLALFTVSSGLCSVMQDGYSFLALRFCMGLGGAGGIVLARAICCDSYQGSALTRFMSLLMAIHSVGPILGPVIGGFVAGAAGWRAVFWLLAAVGVFLTVSCFFILPETLAPRDRVPGGVAASFKNAGRLFRQSAFLCYCGQQGFTMGGFFAYISSSPFIFQKIYGFSVEGFSFIFGITAIGITLFTLLAGLLSKRFSDRGILAWSEVLHALGCYAVLVVAWFLPPSPTAMLVSIFVMLGLQGITMTCSFTLAISAQSVGAGAASGILGVAVFIFGSITSPLAGLAGPLSAMPLGIIASVTGTFSLVLSLVGNHLFESSPGRVNARAMLGEK